MVCETSGKMVNCGRRKYAKDRNGSRRRLKTRKQDGWLYRLQVIVMLVVNAMLELFKCILDGDRACFAGSLGLAVPPQTLLSIEKRIACGAGDGAGTHLAARRGARPLRCMRQLINKYKHRSKQLRKYSLYAHCYTVRNRISV